MSTREDYPAGVPCWVDTNQPDPVGAARFYSGLFGWQTEDAMPPDAGRMGVFADPEGAVFCVWQPGSHRGSAAVNEHGAVNFNNLHTDDVEAAQAFYGAVFGWTTIDAGSPMWALPGYGDHLEELNPGLRAGMKQMGAPDGFEDVVATILPREGGPARWSVTFAVDDVDPIAARARELGGSVLAEPQNAPWVRFAVLADPAGASFTAS